MLLLGLTVVSACIDAISYLGLGKVLPANMTGNTVLLGLGLANGDGPGALRSATALVAFVVGALVVGGALPARVTVDEFLTVAVGEVILVAGLCGWWLGVGDVPTGVPRLGLIALAGATMGAQSALMRLVDVPVSTTYITGTWTSLSAGAGRALRGRPASDDDEAAPPRGLQAIVVSAYLATAYGATLAYRHLAGAATLVPLGVLVLVVVGGLAAGDLG